MAQGYLQSLALQDRKLDFDFLNDVVTRHVATFAFSSVRCWLGDDLPIDFESLYNRIVVKRYGGYCFEQNGLLFQVLKELGFSVRIYLARVILNQDIHPGLTHRITIVDFEGTDYVIDVGFGALGPRVPIPMTGDEATDGDKVFRIAEKQSGEYHMQMLKRGKFFSLYRFDLVRYGQADCELGHFYSHLHADATFVNHLVASVIGESETRSLRNLEYWVIKQSGTKSQKIDCVEQLWQLLFNELGVHVTKDESHRLYERLSAQ